MAYTSFVMPVMRPGSGTCHLWHGRDVGFACALYCALFDPRAGSVHFKGCHSSATGEDVPARSHAALESFQRGPALSSLSWFPTDELAMLCMPLPLHKEERLPLRL